MLTEAGFGADLGAEKFFDIKCRFGELNPEAAMVVATVRALKMHGGVKKDALGKPDVAALKRGSSTSRRTSRTSRSSACRGGRAQSVHLGYARRKSMPCCGAAKGWGARAALSDVWAKGGEGGEAVAREILALLDEGKAEFKPLYDVALPIKARSRPSPRRSTAPTASTTPRRREEDRAVRGHGLRDTPVCMAKTQYCFSDDATKLGRPTGFRLTVRDAYPSAGAGFVVALAGDIMTMPGSRKTPSAEAIRVHPDGTIEGLF